MGKKWKFGVVVVLCILTVVLLLTGLNKFLQQRNIRIQKMAQQVFDNAEQMRLGGKYTAAIEGYNTVLRKYPQYADLPEVYFKIGNVNMYQLHGADEAQQAYETVLQIKNKFPRHKRIPDALVELALIYRAKKKYNEAILLLEEALAVYPAMINKDNVYYQLFMLYGLIGDKKKMEEMFLKRREL